MTRKLNNYYFNLSLSPIYPCLGVQMIDNITNQSHLAQQRNHHHKHNKDSQQSIHRSVLEHLREQMWHLYSHSVQLVIYFSNILSSSEKTQFNAEKIPFSGAHLLKTYTVSWLRNKPITIKNTINMGNKTRYCFGL
jgi:hypothetical protein